MSEEPVDRRGLLRNMLRQATGMIVPSIPAGPSRAAADGPGEHAGLPVRMATLEQLRDAASELGLGTRAGAMAQLARHSLRIAVGAQPGTGAVVFGGQALMGGEREWPSWQGRSLTLLAQVDTGQPLGRLLFFYDTVGRPTGCLAAHAGSACVLQADERSLVLREGPALPAAAVPGMTAPELVLPRASSAAVQALALTPAEQEAWQALREQLAAVQGGDAPDERGTAFKVLHRIFGYPDTADREMPLTVELALHGEDVTEGRAGKHPRAHEVNERSDRWDLLAQFSWDGDLGWPWAAQRLYFWSDREALATGRLGDVWAIAR